MSCGPDSAGAIFQPNVQTAFDYLNEHTQGVAMIEGFSSGIALTRVFPTSKTSSNNAAAVRLAQLPDSGTKESQHADEHW